MATVKVTIRGKPVSVPNGTKADIARALLDQGYSVNEISKAVPMAYSQVHQLNQKRPREVALASIGKASTGRIYLSTKSPSDRITKRLSRPATYDVIKASKGQDPWGELPPRGRPSKKPVKSPMVSRSRVGKLRTPGLPSDIDVGECVNCSHDLVVRGLPTGFVLVHTNISAEEHLAVTQFCQAVPKVLLP